MDPLSEAGDGPFPIVVHEDMTLEPDRHGHGWQGELDFSFRNVSDETITVVTCGRNFSYRLERWTDGEWVATWESFDELCLDVPSLDLDPGGSHDRTISFFGGRPDGRTHPRFSIPDPEGVYRLVIQGAYWRYDYWAAPPGGEEVPFQYRVSGPFRVVVAR